MDIDFPLVLVVLTFFTGFVYLADVLYFSKQREASKAPKASSEDEPKMHWLIDNSRSFFPVLALVLVLRSFLVEPFQIPSGSMLPTLEVGDFILVNKYEYGLRLPVAGTKVVELNDPERGDVIVFKFPEDGKTNYIKRVVGIPGDVIRYDEKQLFINGELVPETLVANLPPYRLAKEQIGNVTHQLMEHKLRRNIQAEGEWVVPENSYFVMGDNRDNSNDSRYWGFVPDELVVGKAFAIWMQWKGLTSLPSFSRAGSIE
ncbi:S26 family signal peptidase [Oleiphilus sp. HI0009]|uniref:signal peptidase I n=2 Tax=Oleiphilus TaxID=141450 RepID=UPI0007C23670|nr:MULTISPECIES: signal peptidase I [unclassified Oleiphilus]KZX79012.1 S26 family signal peptidase [Oleiphilus sp. HI0009]MCH2159390.1 signal peptidase I [Oleiphilaceae bacterium]KZY62053.1 S26 family signal peptidase [Oleiphilus sp. HI0066]KZY62467.1 S26 family signal peptidase [Oleiphilus sp. HI0066]KZY69668.1 S26 family signal peptidase [Oleiphilus sp. HI0067]